METGNPDDADAQRDESERLLSEMQALLERAKKIVKRYEAATGAARAPENQPGDSGRAD